MKKIFYTLGIAFTASISLLSCSKGDYNSGSGQTGYNTFADKNNKPREATTGNFSAKINGVSYNADNDKCWAYGSGNTLIINGFKGTSAKPQGFVLSINKKEKGTYPVNITTGEGSAAYQAEGAGSAVGGTGGSIIISDISDTKVKGTFTMTAAGFDVSEGSFDVTIIKM